MTTYSWNPYLNANISLPTSFVSTLDHLFAFKTPSWKVNVQGLAILISLPQLLAQCLTHCGPDISIYLQEIIGLSTDGGVEPR